MDSKSKVAEAVPVSREHWDDLHTDSPVYGKVRRDVGRACPPDNLEEDPHGTDHHEQGAKLDAGKPDLSLLLMFGRALQSVGEVATAGAVKYSRGGWQFVPSGIDRYTAALLRHLCKEHYETHDPDLAVLHAAQVAWNALARLELILREEEENERKVNNEG